MDISAINLYISARETVSITKKPCGRYDKIYQ